MILTALVRLLRVPSPSWPLLLLPTAQTLPSACRKTVWASPADTLRTGSNHATDPRTRTAASRWVAVPSPSWPLELRPTAQTLPSDLRKTPWLRPAAARVTPVRGPPREERTWTGTLEAAVELLPSWPFVLLPKAQTVPSDFTAYECESPAARCTTPESPGTLTAKAWLTRELIPSWPALFAPQAHTSPVLLNASEWAPPETRFETPVSGPAAVATWSAFV